MKYGSDVDIAFIATGYPASNKVPPEVTRIIVEDTLFEWAYSFKDNIDLGTPLGELLSNCLYDADKFRWGPDNFKDTIWDMVSYFNPPLTDFMKGYPKGMEKIAAIKSTFRTPAGKKFGPQFIDLGLAIGEELYEVIKTEFAEYL